MESTEWLKIKITTSVLTLVSQKSARCPCLVVFHMKHQI